MDDFASFKVLIATVAGAVIGALSSIATFRARFVVIDRQFAEAARERATERVHDKEMLDITLAHMRREIARARRASARMERRQLASLELLAQVAHKLGVEHRAIGVDALARTLNEPESDSDDH